MAREFAQIKLAIWADDDWRDVPYPARYLYLTLLTSPTLNHCGVADWRPARIGALNGMAARDIESFAAELIERLYLVIDEESEEVLIRSFVRNDGLMKQPKMAVAMASAHAGVASKGIRGVVVHELKRLREDYPNLHGWGSDKAMELLGLRSVDPATYPCGKGKRTPIGKGSPTPAPTPTTTTSRLSPSSDDDETDRFNEFWDTYANKLGRKKAEAAYRAALKKPHVTPDLLISAAASYIAWQTAEGKHPQFTKHPATWLNGEHWTDERTGRALPLSRVGQHMALVRQLAAEEQTPQQIGPSA